MGCCVSSSKTSEYPRQQQAYPVQQGGPTQGYYGPHMPPQHGALLVNSNTGNSGFSDGMIMGGAVGYMAASHGGAEGMMMGGAGYGIGPGFGAPNVEVMGIDVM